MSAASEHVALLLTALASISVPPSDLDKLTLALHSEPARLTLEDLGLDSLGRMEACITLEIDHGVLITPEEMGSLYSADQLLCRIAAAPRA
jgi:acyl carrier protein